jgi:hypoxanthine phosphoribosyltransferase
MATQYLPVSWSEYHSLAQKLAATILDNGTRADEIVAIARGGLTLGHLLSDFLRIPICSITIQSYTDIQRQGKVQITAGLNNHIRDKKILLVDDIADSGKTLERATKYLEGFHPASITIVTMFYKPHSTVRPDYFAKQTSRWILLPSEITEWVYTFTKKMESEGKSKKEIQDFLESLGYNDSQIAFVRRHYLGK